MKRILGFIKRSIIFYTVVITLSCPVYAASFVQTEQLLEKDDINDSDIPEKTELKENSWRYTDGVLNYESDPYLKNRANYPNAWKKINGRYVNDLGEVIPKATKKGIDVSEHNGIIDWDKVKADGIEFAIIRCGYGSDYLEQDDKQWLRNVSECERLGIPYGVYLYSYADTLSKARSEAVHTLRLLRGHSPQYPVYYDLEDEKVYGLSNSMKGEIAEIFCNTIAAEGYKTGIYSSLYWWNSILTDYRFNNPSWSRWVAQWNSSCTYKNDYDAWQCTSNGNVNGIQGRVDLNFWLEEDVNENVTVEYSSDRNGWYVFKNGNIDWNYMGIVHDNKGWFYAENGKINWNYNGVKKNDTGWFSIKNGKVDWSYTGVVQDSKGWFYVRNGIVDWSYTGVVQDSRGWFYVRNGIVDWSYTGVVQDFKGWFYVRNGIVDWSYTGVVQDFRGWFYVRNGIVDWSYTGVVQDSKGWFYVRNGIVDWNYM